MFISVTSNQELDDICGVIRKLQQASKPAFDLTTEDLIPTTVLEKQNKFADDTKVPLYYFYY